MLKNIANSIYGKIAGVILVIGLALLIWIWYDRNPMVADSYARQFVCSETGKAFVARLKIGDSPVVISPYTGKRTGHLAELCYWNKDGTIRETPVAVLLGIVRGSSEPTFCPDCGRLVVTHNPMPGPGSTPPPTRDEYNPHTHAQMAGERY